MIRPPELTQLEQQLRQLGPVAVATSGGVDSMTLAVVAHRLDPRSEIYHALSPAVPTQATARVQHYAQKEHWQLHLLNAGEINDPRYVENPVNRCYFCKTNLYGSISHETQLTVVSGTNTDDLGDYRPGLIAASEHAVRHPYVDAGISKAELRGIARYIGLDDIHDLPAAPCLSSRVTTGIAIDATLLPVINTVEQQLWQHLQAHLPLQGVRCRIKPSQVTIEIQTSVTIDPSRDYIISALDMVRSLFIGSGHAQQVEHIDIAPYQRGSAFLIDTVAIK
jgi:uncharacterized protein